MNWKILNNKLTISFEFKNQTALANFLLLVAKKADEVNHHPDATISKCSHLQLELFTHTANKITNLDKELAAAILDIYNNLIT
jgi:4a-hydroxytetrahydrobiopterin dehydratase